MKVNVRNLAIAKHCASKPHAKGHRIDLLHFTPAGTIAVNEDAAYQLGVSLPEPSTENFAIDPGVAIGMAPGNIDPFFGQTGVSLRAINTQGAVTHEMTIDPGYLIEILQAAEEFGAKAVRIRFHGVQEPIILDARDPENGQVFEATLMPRFYDQDMAKIFDDSEEAIAARLAAKLVG